MDVTSLIIQLTSGAISSDRPMSASDPKLTFVATRNDRGGVLITDGSRVSLQHLPDRIYLRHTSHPEVM